MSAELARGNWETYEAEAVPASHLMSCQCVGCGVPTLATPEHVADARCGPCRGGGVLGKLGAYAPVVGYPMGTYVEAEEVRVEHPAPELPAHWCSEMPEVVRKLAGDAPVSHARGTGMHGSTGRPTSVRESWAVRLRRGEEQAVAVYSKPGGWGSMWIWGPARPHWSCPTLADLLEWVAGGLDFAAVDQRVAEAALAGVEMMEARRFVMEIGVADAVRFFGLELEIPELYEIVKPKVKKAREGAS